jgi:hypothetical protein
MEARAAALCAECTPMWAVERTYLVAARANIRKQADEHCACPNTKTVPDLPYPNILSVKVSAPNESVSSVLLTAGGQVRMAHLVLENHLSTISRARSRLQRVDHGSIATSIHVPDRSPTSPHEAAPIRQHRDDMR